VTLSLTDPANTGLDITSTQSQVFNLGAANKLVIANQPVGNVLTNQVFATVPVVQLTDSHNNVITTNSSTVVTATAYSGANCTNIASGVLGGTSSVSLTSGAASFDNLSFSKADAISIKFQAAGFGFVCTTGTLSIYNPLMITPNFSSVNTGGVATVEVNGGVPPLGSYYLSTNLSGAILSAADSCISGNTCIKYTSGNQGGDVTDVVSISDARGNMVSSSFSVSGAFLRFTNPAYQSNFGTPGVDTSVSFTVSNLGSNPSTTGAISVTLTPDVASMWSVISTGCTGANLGFTQTCTIALTFNAASGTGASGIYRASILVRGATSGATTLNVQGTK
jgi:hypothetical protein